MNANPTVMIVDDEEHIRMLIKGIVSNLNYRVIAEASDGNNAIELYEKSKPDMVLLDIIMPNMSGDMALKEIKNNYPDSCIIMLSSITDEETMKICMDYGATCYIKKTTPLPEMETMIKDIWETYSKLHSVIVSFTNN